MPLNVGDAVLSFLGDTTNLDQAFARIPGQTDAAMSAAAGSVGQVGDALQDVSFELDATATNAAYAGGEIRDAMTEATGSVRGVGEQARVVEEMLGVRLPRGVNRFLAELPGVQSAMTTAFSAGVVYFLAEALVQGTEKLSNWIGQTFINTQAMRDNAEVQLTLNKQYLANAEAIEKAKTALEEYGLTAVQKTQKSIDDENQKIAANTAIMEANRAKIAELTKEQEVAASGTTTIVHGMAIHTEGVKGNTQAIQDLKNASALLTLKNEELALSIQVLKNEMRDEAEAAAAKAVALQEQAAKTEISIDESVGMSKIKRWEADAKYQAAFSRDAADLILKIEEEQAEKEYQLRLLTLQKERMAEEQASRGYKGAGDTEKYNKEVQQQQQTDAKIEALTAEHYAKQKEMATKSDQDILKLQADLAVAAQTLAKGIFPNLPEDTRDLLSMSQAAERLGITLSKDLAKTAKEAQEALKLLDQEYKAGIISQRDYQSAEMKALQAQIEYDKELGKSPALVKAEEQQLDKLKKAFDDAYGAKGSKLLTTFFSLFHNRHKQGEKDAKDLAKAIDDFEKQTSQAYASAIMGAITSGQSIGAALAQATKAILLQLGEQALAKSLYYLAEGIAASVTPGMQGMAAGYFAASAEFAVVAGLAGGGAMAMGGGGSGGGPGGNTITSSANPSGAGQPTPAGGGGQQTVSTPHLAAGGVVMRPTMFLAGEDAEAILPLTDPEAMNRISSALLSTPTLRAGGSRGAHFSPDGSAGGGGGGDTIIHVHVKGLISADNLNKVVKTINQKVHNRQLTLNASNSLRFTRRSQ